MQTQQVDITDEQAAFIQRSIAAGHFADAGELIRVALDGLERDVEDEAAKLAELSRIATEAFAALDRGEGIMVPADQIRSYVRSIAEQAILDARR